MSHAISHTSAIRQAIGDLIRSALGSNSKIKIYSGPVPATADVALTGDNILLSTITGIVLGASVNAVNAITSSTASQNATAGDPTFYRWTTSADVVVQQGSIGTVNTDLVLNSLTIQAGASTTLSTGRFTAPA